MGPRTETLGAPAALAVQGPILAYLARQSLCGYAAFSLASLALGLALRSLLAGRSGEAARAAALPVSLGMLGMLAGLYADAGFGPLVGRGLCLCGCPDSLTGIGLLGRFRWMQALMVGACAAAALANRRQREPVTARAAAATLPSSLLMLAGMGAAGAAAGRFGIQDPALALVASYLAMSAGMAAGWACARRVPAFPSSRPALSPLVRRPSAGRASLQP
jgi:hypothetical protein